MNKPVIYLLPTPLGESIHPFFYYNEYKECIIQTNNFFVESIRKAKSFIKKILKHNINLDEKNFYEYNEHTKEKEIYEYIKIVSEARINAIMVEAGFPCIADPGHKLILLCHLNDITVKPFFGFSGITLAISCSGLPAQKFKFLGYLPKKENELIKTIKKIEQDSRKENITIAFMETPYRTIKLFKILLSTLNPDTYLSISSNLTQNNELIKTYPVKYWIKKNLINIINNDPSIFVIYAPQVFNFL